jgi:hypothetical protein
MLIMASGFFNMEQNSTKPSGAKIPVLPTPIFWAIKRLSA